MRLKPAGFFKVFETDRTVVTRGRSTSDMPWARPDASLVTKMVPPREAPYRVLLKPFSGEALAKALGGVR